MRSGRPARQLQQRQRVTPRLGHDLVAHLLVQRPRDHRSQELPRIRLAETLDQQLRESPQLLTRLARRKQHHDRLRLQPTRHKRQRLCRDAIQPLRVVHDAHKRLLHSDL